MLDAIPSSLRAQTLHDDLIGTVAADLRDSHESLLQLAAQAGLDIDRLRPVGLNVQWQGGQWVVSLLVLPRALSQDEALPVQRIRLALPPERVLRHLPLIEVLVLDRTADIGRLILPEGPSPDSLPN